MVCKYVKIPQYYYSQWIYLLINFIIIGKTNEENIICKYR